MEEFKIHNFIFGIIGSAVMATLIVILGWSVDILVAFKPMVATWIIFFICPIAIGACMAGDNW